MQWPLLTYGVVIDQDGAPFQVYRDPIVCWLCGRRPLGHVTGVVWYQPRRKLVLLAEVHCCDRCEPESIRIVHGAVAARRHRVWTYHRPDHPRPRRSALVDVCEGCP